MVAEDPVEGGRRDRASLGRAAEILVARGRLYSASKRYTNLVVFGTARSELDFLRYVLGGSIYKHRTGYVWVLAKYKALRELHDELDAYPEFQTKLRELLQRSGRAWEKPPDIEELRLRRRRGTK